MPKPVLGHSRWWRNVSEYFPVLTFVAFVVALGLLIAVHEYGHYRMAVACGVKVLRFSIGFGRPLVRWQSSVSKTEFVLSALPLGGYVRMLDEREAPVPEDERHLAFNTQPLRSRALIVAAGPVANLLLAVALYAGVSWIGVLEPRAILSVPAADTLAARAGLQGGQWVQQLAVGEEQPEPVESFNDLRWRLTQATLDQQAVRLWVASGPDALAQEVVLPLPVLDAQEADAQLFQKIGIVAPWSAPVVGDVIDGGAAERAGLMRGDRVQQVDAVLVEDAQSLRALIRRAVDSQGMGQPQQWQVLRGGRTVALTVTPQVESHEGQMVGRIGAYIGAPPEMVMVTRDFADGVWHGMVRTWEVSGLSLKMMVKMLVGEASVKNLSGPLSIADYAGKSAHAGLTSYLQFLALISVSLGVLNLLPLPVLDGGHLMYYLWEGATGRPVSDLWMERLQRGGVALMAALMSLAVFNDIARFLG